MKDVRVIESIAKLSKTKKLYGIILDVTGSTCTVRVGDSWTIYNVKMVGGPFTAGQRVDVQWDGHSPYISGTSTLSSTVVNASVARSGNLTQPGMLELTGWSLSTTGIISHDSGSFRLDPNKPSLELGNATGYMTGIGVFLGKAASSYYSVHIGDPGGHYLYFNGSDGSMKFTGEFLGVITGTSSDVFTINSDLQDVTSKLIFGRTTGGNAEISWNGTVVDINKNTQITGSLLVGASGNYLKADSSAVIINEAASGSLNFRVEGMISQYLIFADAFNGYVGIANGSPSSTLDVTGSIKASTALYIGTAGNYLKVESSYVIVNENQADIDFRVESDISDYLIVADAGLDKVGIGTNSPQAKLHVLGSTPQARISYDVSNYSEFSVGASGTLTITTSTGGNLGLSPNGDVIFNPGGNDILPEINYDLNIGGIQKKYLTLHAAELWVETLVAQETIATIGGRIIVAPTTMLTADLGAQTDIIASLNPSFETSGSGGADVFANWSESAGNGFIAKSGAQYYHGAYSCSLTAGSSFNTWVYQTFSGLNSQYICWTFWARGNGTVAGRYGLYNVTGGSYIIGLTSTGVTGTTWTQVIVKTSIPAGADNVRFEFWCPTTNGAATFFDLTSILTYPAIQVKHNLFAVGDIVHVESNGKFEFMKIDSAYSGSAGAYTYDVTRNLDGTGSNAWYAGDAVVNTGQAGSGYMDLYSMESIYGRSPDYLYNYNNTGTAFSINYAGTTSWNPFADGANTEVNDAVYIGNAVTFGSLNIVITSAAVSTVTYAYEYWNGSAWTTLGTITRTLDGVDAGSTENFEATGTWILSWSIPGNWAQNTVNSISAYWVRIRISAFTSYGTVASAVGKRAHIGKSQWGPTIVGWRRSSATWNDVNEYWAIGNLNGLYGYGLDTPGAAFGRYAATNTWVSIDATYGFRVNVGGASYTTIGQWDTSGNVTVGVSNGAHLYIANAGAITIYDSGNVPHILINTSGINVGNYTSAEGYYGVFLDNEINFYERRSSTPYLRSRISDTGFYIYDTNGSTVLTEITASNIILGDNEAANGAYVHLTSSAFTINRRVSSVGYAVIQMDSSGNAIFGQTTGTSANMFWSSTTGHLQFRTGTGAAQAYIDASTGALMAGGGTVTLNTSGITLTMGQSDYNKIKWGTASEIYTYAYSTENYMQFQLDSGGSLSRGTFAFMINSDVTPVTIYNSGSTGIVDIGGILSVSSTCNLRGLVKTGSDLYTHLSQGANRSLRVTTHDTGGSAYGYLEIGPQNTSWCHMMTDRANFYFSTSICVSGNFIYYNGGSTITGALYVPLSAPISLTDTGAGAWNGTGNKSTGTYIFDLQASANGSLPNCRAVYLRMSGSFGGTSSQYCGMHPRGVTNAFDTTHSCQVANVSHNSHGIVRTDGTYFDIQAVVVGGTYNSALIQIMGYWL